MPDDPNTDEPVERSQDAAHEQANASAQDAAADQPDAQPEADDTDAEPQGAAQGEAAPQATLGILINSIATQVFVSLGVVENPLTGKKQKDLDSAKFSIDLLNVLAEKTQGNLTDMEKRYLEGVLYELRMRFVQAAEDKAPSDADAQTSSAAASDGAGEDNG